METTTQQPNEKDRAIARDLGRRLKSIRTYVGVTQDELAHADELVTMDDLENDYSGINFTPDDFACSAAVYRVAFRAFEDGEIIALFPDEITDAIHGLCMSYVHVGQHASASLVLLHELRHATPDEYAPLLAELQDIGYNVQVDDRYPIGRTA